MARRRGRSRVSTSTRPLSAVLVAREGTRPRSVETRQQPFWSRGSPWRRAPGGCAGGVRGGGCCSGGGCCPFSEHAEVVLPEGCNQHRGRCRSTSSTPDPTRSGSRASDIAQPTIPTPKAEDLRLRQASGHQKIGRLSNGRGMFAVKISPSFCLRCLTADIIAHRQPMRRWLAGDDRE